MLIGIQDLVKTLLNFADISSETTAPASALVQDMVEEFSSLIWHKTTISYRSWTPAIGHNVYIGLQSLWTSCAQDEICLVASFRVPPTNVYIQWFDFMYGGPTAGIQELLAVLGLCEEFKRCLLFGV